MFNLQQRTKIVLVSVKDITKCLNLCFLNLNSKCKQKSLQNGTGMFRVMLK